MWENGLTYLGEKIKIVCKIHKEKEIVITLQKLFSGKQKCRECGT